MKWITFLLISMVLLLGACTNEGETSQNNTQPIHQETKRELQLKNQSESIGEQGGYKQSEQQKVNIGEQVHYTDPYTNDGTEAIRKQLIETKDIVQAQVAETDDEVIVAVILSEKFNMDVAEQKEVERVLDNIEQKVKQMIPATDKEIIVYTDTVHWNRMKNLDTRTKTRDNDGNTNKQYQMID